MTVNLNEPYNEYQWSIIPMMDQDLVIVIGEQNLERKVTVAYNFKNAEVKAAVLETAAWGAEQCAGLGDLFYHLYVDESVIPEALNNVNLALGDHLTTLSYCTIFEPLGPISLSYGSNSDQLVAQFTKIGGTDSGQLVYDKNSGRYWINSAADQLDVYKRQLIIRKRQRYPQEYDRLLEECRNHNLDGMIQKEEMTAENFFAQIDLGGGLGLAGGGMLLKYFMKDLAGIPVMDLSLIHIS